MKVALVVIYNLLLPEINDDEKIGKIEATVRSILEKHWLCKLNPKDVVYSFPHDPSVITPGISVACDITLLPTKYLRQRGDTAQKIVNELYEELRILLNREEDSILVIGRDSIHKPRCVFASNEE